VVPYKYEINIPEIHLPVLLLVLYHYYLFQPGETNRIIASPEKVNVFSFCLLKDSMLCIYSLKVKQKYMGISSGIKNACENWKEYFMVIEPD
jgi:hypothetical protein